MDCSPPGSSVLGISQARMLEWVAMPSSIQGLFPTQGSNLHLLCLLPWQLCSLPLPHLGSPFFEAGCWTIGQRELSLRKLGENLRLGDGRPRSGVMHTSFPCTDGPGPLSYCGCSDPGGEQGGDQQGLGPFGESGALWCRPPGRKEVLVGHTGFPGASCMPAEAGAEDRQMEPARAWLQTFSLVLPK